MPAISDATIVIVILAGVHNYLWYDLITEVMRIASSVCRVVLFVCFIFLMVAMVSSLVFWISYCPTDAYFHAAFNDIVRAYGEDF